MEASALRHAARVPVLTGLSPHLRLQSDERLVALVRRGHHGAFEALLKRYHPRLLAFCRHMLRSNEDAEDVLQEVFASAYRAICADERPINARPWLYRIARNRCLNHLRRPQDAGQESMDIFEREAGATTADAVHGREEFKQIVADVHELPETQRTALLLREIDTLSYDQIAEAMETTVPSVKSLLVRARMSLAEASEARHLTCAEVRLQLSQSCEGIAKPAAPTRRHVRSCPRCRSFRRELRRTSHALAAVYPIGPLVAAKAVLGGGGSAGAAVGNGAAGGSTAAGAGALAGGGAAGVISAVGGSVVSKAAAGLVAAAIVTVGAVEVRQGDVSQRSTPAPPPTAAPADDRARPTPPVAAAEPGHAARADQAAAIEAGRAEPRPGAAAPPEPEQAPPPAEPAAEEPSAAPVEPEEPSSEPHEGGPSSHTNSSSDAGVEEDGDFPLVTEPAEPPPGDEKDVDPSAGRSTGESAGSGTSATPAGATAEGSTGAPPAGGGTG